LIPKNFQSEITTGKYSRWAGSYNSYSLRAIIWVVDELGKFCPQKSPLNLLPIQKALIRMFQYSCLLQNNPKVGNDCTNCKSIIELDCENCKMKDVETALVNGIANLHYLFPKWARKLNEHTLIGLLWCIGELHEVMCGSDENEEYFKEKFSPRNIEVIKCLNEFVIAETPLTVSDFCERLVAARYCTNYLDISAAKFEDTLQLKNSFKRKEFINSIWANL